MSLQAVGWRTDASLIHWKRQKTSCQVRATHQQASCEMDRVSGLLSFFLIDIIRLAPLWGDGEHSGWNKNKLNKIVAVTRSQPLVNRGDTKFIETTHASGVFSHLFPRIPYPQFVARAQLTKWSMIELKIDFVLFSMEQGRRKNIHTHKQTDRQTDRQKENNTSKWKHPKSDR